MEINNLAHGATHLNSKVLPFTLVRFVSLLLALLITIPETNTAYAILFSAGLVHFWFSFYYGFPELNKSYNERGKFWLLAFLGYSIFATIYQKPIVTISLFGLHAVLSEAYFALREQGKQNSRLIFARALFEAVIYFTVSLHAFYFKFRLDLTYSLLAISLGYFLFEWFRARNTLTKHTHWDVLGCQTVSLLVFGLVYFVLDLQGLRATLVLIFLHGGPWMVYPIVKNGFKLQSESTNRVLVYVAATVALTVFTVPLMLNFPIFFKTMNYLYYFWVNIHIFQGFVATYASPNWLKGLFFNQVNLIR